MAVGVGNERLAREQMLPRRCLGSDDLILPGDADRLMGRNGQAAPGNDEPAVRIEGGDVARNRAAPASAFHAAGMVDAAPVIDAPASGLDALCPR